MQAEVKWVEDFKFLGQSQSGHSVVMDGNGGATAPSPMEMVLMAAGGCSSVDVVDGLKTAGQKVTSVNAKLTTERRETACANIDDITFFPMAADYTARVGGGNVDRRFCCLDS